MKFIFFIVSLAYLSSMVYPNTERYIYNNEIFSLLGFVFFLLAFFQKKLPFYGLSSFYLFILYGFILALSSVTNIINTGLYLSLRTMVVWYSLFGFFLGLYIFNYFSLEKITQSINKFQKISWTLLFASHSRLSPQIIFSFGQKSTFKGYLFFLLLMTIFYLAKPGSTTITAVLIASALYLWANSASLKNIFGKRLILALALSGMVALYFLLPILKQFLVSGYDGVSGDNNATWRLMFWLYLFKEQLLNNPLFGLGFGTKLFDLAITPNFITSDDGTRLTEYTLGAHNSFFYTAIRMGGIGFILSIMTVIKIYAVAVKAYKSATKIETKNIIFSLILANLMFVNSALFNVVLESPLYAANFWFTLGLMYSFSTKVIKGAC